MIKSNDLRVGNWVEYMEDGTKFKVTEINPTGISVENTEESTWIELDQFSGLKLTYELLEKFGFERRFKTEDCNIWDGHDITLALLEKGWKYLTAPGAKPFQFVHQLQNLFYCISHEELKIEL